MESNRSDSNNGAIQVEETAENIDLVGNGLNDDVDNDEVIVNQPINFDIPLPPTVPEFPIGSTGLAIPEGEPPVISLSNSQNRMDQYERPPFTLDESRPVPSSVKTAPVKSLRDPFLSRITDTKPSPYKTVPVVKSLRDMNSSTSSIHDTGLPSQNYDLQNISSINMNLPNPIDETPACPNGSCAVARQLTPQFNTTDFSFAPNNTDTPPQYFPNSSHSSTPAPPPLPERSINLSSEPALPQTDRQSEQLPVNITPPPQAGTAAPPPLPTKNTVPAVPAQTGVAPPATNNTVPAVPTQTGGINNNTKFPALPTTTTQHHYPTTMTQFNQYKPTNPFTYPVNQPVNQPAGQLAKATLPTFNNACANACANSNSGGLIRPPAPKSDSKVPTLLWDTRAPITNMRSLTAKKNKNILNHIQSVDNAEIAKIFPYMLRLGPEKQVFKRYVISQEPIILAYTIPDNANVKRAWKNQYDTDPKFRKDVDEYNQKIIEKLSQFNNMSVQQINDVINNLLAEYINSNTDRLSSSSNNRSSAAFTSWNGSFINNQVLSNQQAPAFNNNNNNVPPQQQQAPAFNNNNVPPQQQQPCVYYKTRKDCMDSAEPIKGYRRVMRSQNPCVVDYIEIKNKNDLQNSMIGCTVDNPINTDSECAVKYNMIKTFLDESGYHLVKNSTRKSRKSRKN